MNGYRRIGRLCRVKRYNLGRGYFGLGISYSHGTISVEIARWVWDFWRPSHLQRHLQRER